MDGGIRSRPGRAQGLGAGRARHAASAAPWLYGLGAMGEAGVTKALQIIHKELDVTMAFCGHTDIRNVDRRILVPGSYPA